MWHCKWCASNSVYWFTPREYAAFGAILLCSRCGRITIRIGNPAPRFVRAEALVYRDNHAA